MLASSALTAKTFNLPPSGNNVIGEIFTVAARGGDSLYTIARRYDMGLDEVISANPSIGNSMLSSGARVVIPQLFILPNAPRRGIIINLAEKRLYYFPKGKGVVETYPVGIGKEGSETPLMTTRIVEKKANPTWTPPASVRAEVAAQGIMLPDIMPPGPDNPLGKFAMRLGLPSYLIHGTNRPYGVGRRVSAGCVRMYPEDIERLFGEVKVGESVEITHKAFRAGWRGNRLYFDAHPALTEHAARSDHSSLMTAVSNKLYNFPFDIDWQKARQISAIRDGVPHVIGTRHMAANKKQQKTA